MVVMGKRKDGRFYVKKRSLTSADRAKLRELMQKYGKAHVEEFVLFMKVKPVGSTQKMMTATEIHEEKVTKDFRCPGCPHLHAKGSTCVYCGHKRGDK